MFLRADGQRLDRHGAERIVRRIAKRAGIAEPISLHRCGTRSSPPRSAPR
jgi:site-specific recombinase XerD